MMYLSLKKYSFIALVLTVPLCNCTTEDTTSVLDEGAVTLEHTALFEETEGTTCCVLGPDKVAPGTEESYEYLTNIPLAKMGWSVVSGSMELMDSNQDSTQIILKFNADFTEGILAGKGQNDLIGCSEQLTIRIQ